MSDRPQLVAVDIDGTLVSSAGTLLPGTRAEFARARSAGAVIALASGRPVAGLRLLMRRVRLDSAGVVLIGVNGAVVVDADSGEVLTRRSVPIATATGLARSAGGQDITVMFCDGDELVVDRPDDAQVRFEAEGNGLRLRAVPDLAAVSGEHVTVDKVLLHADPARLRAFAREVEREFGDVTETSFSAPFYLEATARGVDKGSALTALAGARGIPLSATIAFGDNGNDLPMLRAAGVGVAMANATRQVLQAADRITASHDDEGIAAVLADVFGGGVPAPGVPEPDGQEQVYALDLRELGGLVHPDDA